MRGAGNVRPREANFRGLPRMSNSSPPSKPTPQPANSPKESPSEASPLDSSPRLGNLPPEVMWQAYNHAMLLLAMDLRWRREREKQKL